jgi:hypothetical protein
VAGAGHDLGARAAGGAFADEAVAALLALLF